MIKYNGVLIIGPTGSGKTPLGDFLSTKTFFSKKAFHFDFGENLRKIEILYKNKNFSELKKAFSLLNNKDINTILSSLENGTLLEDDQFYIAKNILLSFIEENKISKNNIIILNGLPRHKGQAEKIEKIINIDNIIYLDCNEDTVYKRIKTNSGGDRTERTDDSVNEIRNKLKIFKERTKKLLEYYSAANVINIKISEKTGPENIYNRIIKIKEVK